MHRYFLLSTSWLLYFNAYKKMHAQRFCAKMVVYMAHVHALKAMRELIVS
ncbi:MAG: hypothetical protein RIQ33_1925 [Bacteroidota bacterium]|jgi:hypothetical protein